MVVQRLDKAKVVGSTPTRTTNFTGGHVLRIATNTCNVCVVGLIPILSTNFMGQ